MGILVSCLFAILISFLVGVILPIYIIVKAIKWGYHYFHKDEIPWRRVGEPGDRPPREEAAGGNTGSDAAARAEAAAARAEALARSKKEKLAAVMKKQNRLDRLALVYYIEYSVKAGLGEGAIAPALKAKGWPEDEVAEAFHCFQQLSRE